MFAFSSLTYFVETNFYKIRISVHVLVRCQAPNSYKNVNITHFQVNSCSAIHLIPTKKIMCRNHNEK